MTHQSGNGFSALVPNSSVGNHENYDCQARSQLPVLRSNRNNLILQKYCRVLIEDEEVTENENIVFFKIACKIDHWCI